jgi:uncharacterized protein
MDFEGARSYALNYLETKIGKQYYYHNIDHTKDVFHAVTEFADAEEISGKDIQLLQLAALYHDLGIWIDYNNHERISSLIARKTLPDFGFRKGQIDSVCRLILATKITGQPEDHMSQLLCDADLDYLGRPDYFKISERLRKEWKACGIRSYSNEEWILYQLDFLHDHQYYTQVSRSARDKGKSANILKIMEIIKKS